MRTASRSPATPARSAAITGASAGTPQRLEDRRRHVRAPGSRRARRTASARPASPACGTRRCSCAARPGRPAAPRTPRGRTSASGCACNDSGASAARTFIRYGSRTPNSSAPPAPSWPFGSSAMSVGQADRPGRAADRGRVTRVRAEPQLRLRVARSGAGRPCSCGDRRPGTPRVRPDRRRDRGMNAHARHNAQPPVGGTASFIERPARSARGRRVDAAACAGLVDVRLQVDDPGDRHGRADPRLALVDVPRDIRGAARARGTAIFAATSSSSGPRCSVFMWMMRSTPAPASDGPLDLLGRPRRRRPRPAAGSSSRSPG